MNSSERFRVSLHVSHPKLPADDIAASFALRLRYARSAGAPRMTKQGKALGGTYAQTDVSFAVSDGVVSNDDVLLGEFVDRAVNALPLDALDQIVSSGGSCFFFLGIYAEGNILCDFDANLLSRLASHGIGLKLDFYGGPEVAPIEP
jgi:hypothetical protein